jgi:hypothetical protein
MSSLTDGTKFNSSSTYFVSSTGTSLAGVLSLNGVSGVVNITSPDTSITATGSPGTVALSTTGNALAPSTVTASGNISSATNITATGVVSGAIVSASGTVSGATVASSGAITGTSLALTGSMTSLFNNSVVETIPGVASGTVQGLTALNVFLTLRNPTRSCLIMLNVSGGTPFPNGIPFSQCILAVPPINSGTGDVGAIVYGAQDGLATSIQPSGATGARSMVISTQNNSSEVQTYTVSWTVFGA